MVVRLKSPYPWWGGKSQVAAEVWRRFGDVPNLVEPFFGSGAFLLARPHEPGIETVNDLDGFVSNFWRALKADPAAVTEHADWIVSENDLHARHAWLVARKDSIQARLEGDPDFFDAKVAGWWVWGTCCWIGAGFCSGQGPWQVVEQDGVRQLVHLGNAGQGVNRQRVHLGNAGQGVNRQRVALAEYLAALSDRMHRVRVCCGDWTRVCGPTPTVKQGVTGVFLDAPYRTALEDGSKNRDGNLYLKDGDVVDEVIAYCLEQGGNPKMRIAACCYEGEGYEVLLDHGWQIHAWKAKGGYASQADEPSKNAGRERIFFSPNCLKVDGLYDGLE